MRKYVNYLFCLSVVMLLLSCENKEKNLPEDFDYGNIAEGKYTNAYFDLQIPFNTSWSVQSQEQVNQMAQKGEEIVVGDNKMLKAAVKAAQVNVAYLFTVFEHEVGSVEGFNPSFMVVAENTKNFPQMTKGKDYLVQAKKLLEQSQIPYAFEKEIYGIKVGSKDFDVMETQLVNGEQTIYQDYVSTISNGFSLSFILSYADEVQRKELYGMLQQIKI